MKHILVTGCAGFIGMHVAEKLLNTGYHVIGIDNLNSYYNNQLKKDRLNRLIQKSNFDYSDADLLDTKSVHEFLNPFDIDYVIHLAAQPGVRYSIDHPEACIQNNIVAFTNVLELCRQRQVKHLVYASSSSVYGMNTQTPYSTDQNVDHPVSLYAASKKSNELMAHCYSHLFKLPTTGLRFFTVYGPWGRPDMAYYKFTQAILEGKEIELYGEGKMKRDFTYVDDIVEAVARLISKPAVGNQKWEGKNPDPATSPAPYRIYNIGNNAPVELARFVSAIEAATGKKAKIVKKPVPPGDVLATAARVDDLAAAVDFRPKTSIEDGIKKFVDWYRGYAGV